MIPFPDISPELFSISIFGIEFALRWYALAYIVGIVLGWRIAVLALRRPKIWPDERAPMAPERAEDLMTWVIIGILAGGRLGYVLFYRPGYYLENPLEIPMLWTGGMSFHGGFLGVVLAVWWFYRRQGVPYLQGADLLSICIWPGILLGRLANFVNAELWGRPTDLPWGVIFPGEAAQACGQITGLCARHPSQLYEALLEGLILGGLLMWLAFARKVFQRPGMSLGIFLAGYGLARFAVEFVRQPDAQFISEGNPLGLAFQIDGWGITMGQALSLPMIVVGLWFILRARPRDAR